MKQIKVIFASLALSAALAAQAQTVKWQIRPGIYDSIETVSNDYLKYKQGRFVGFMTADGKEIGPRFDGDFITFFHDDQALVLKRQGSYFRLVSIVDYGLVPHYVDEDMFVDEFPYFSDGRLLVFKLNKKMEKVYAYVDRYGKPVTKFNIKVAEPYMNTNGENEKGLGGKLRDKLKKGTGDSESPEAATNTMAKSATQGLNRTRAATIDKYIVSEHFTPDANGPVPFRDSLSWKSGFKSGGKTVVPAQFTWAGPFHGGYAVVTNARKEDGLLALVDGSVSAVQILESGSFETGEIVRFKVTAPESLDKKNIGLMATLTDGTALMGETIGSYSENAKEFRLTLPPQERTVEVIFDGIVLSRERMDKLTRELVDVKVSASRTSARADMNDKASIVFTVTNPHDVDLNLNVTAFGGTVYVSKKKLTVKAGGKETVTATWSKIRKRTTGTFSVSGDGVNPKSISVNLTPYF